ncbi:HK97 family phage prohead protease [Liquorilactobacillus ghanensis]|uniref:HK97 family phage prohead protease n=1 Tax=Liquorilactobacillus ghanensis TaxID=399370 RepID=UPI0039E7A74B
MTTDLETRQVTTKIQIRTADDEKTPQTIEGYALKFNRQSDVLGGGFMPSFRETINSHALDNADMSNVVATFNHDENQILGRTGVNLKLSVDDIGLKFEVQPPDTQLARDLMTNIAAGIINQCSFAFTIPDSDDAQDWNESDSDDAQYQRKINKIDHLYDVSVVTTPAYPDTEAVVGQRSKTLVEKLVKEKDSWKQERKKMLLELKKQEILDQI